MQLLSVACLSQAAKMEETEVPLLWIYKPSLFYRKWLVSSIFVFWFLKWCVMYQAGESKFVSESRTLKWMMQAVTPFSFIIYNHTLACGSCSEWYFIYSILIFYTTDMPIYYTFTMWTLINLIWTCWCWLVESFPSLPPYFYFGSLSLFSFVFSISKSLLSWSPFILLKAGGALHTHWLQVEGLHIHCFMWPSNGWFHVILQTLSREWWLDPRILCFFI